MSEKTCFQIRPEDNVAVVLEDVEQGESVRIIGETTGELTLLDAIEYGHKVALADIPQGQAVTKYGIRIGTATMDIRQGENVHLHNCASDYDERSNSFDPETGAAIDTQYG